MSTFASRFAVLTFAAALPATVSQAAVSFEKEILPVLTQKCMGCHKASFEENGKKKEPKAGLRLDASWAILKGSENGPVLSPGAPDKSELYEVVMLPKDDDGHMPPKGDDLTPAEIKALKTWIEEGANFGGWIGSKDGMPSDAQVGAKEAKAREHELLYAALEKEVKPIPDAALAKAKAGGAQVSAVKVDSPLVRVDFLTGVSKCDDARTAVLLEIKENVVQLDLGRTAITDATLKDTVAKLPRLLVLDLRQTKVSDAGLEALVGLKKLQTLNLYGTEVTDAGLKALAKIKSLKNVYLWQSKATEGGVKQLTAAIPGLKASVK